MAVATTTLVRQSGLQRDSPDALSRLDRQFVDPLSEPGQTPPETVTDRSHTETDPYGEHQCRPQSIHDGLWRRGTAGGEGEYVRCDHATRQESGQEYRPGSVAVPDYRRADDQYEGREHSSSDTDWRVEPNEPEDEACVQHEQYGREVHQRCVLYVVGEPRGGHCSVTILNVLTG